MAAEKTVVNLKQVSILTGIAHSKIYNNINGVYKSLTSEEKESIRNCIREGSEEIIEKHFSDA